MNVTEITERVVVKGRATVDTRPPFRSVKEAVALFGERVLVAQVYANQLKQIETKESVEEGVSTSRGAVPVELEETKQELKKAKEEGDYMANCLKSLRDELEQTKRELQHLKSIRKPALFENPKPINNPEIEEDLKIVQVNPNPRDVTYNNAHHHTLVQDELQKKKFVTFASPPSLTREMKHNASPSAQDVTSAPKLGRTPSFNKDGKKKTKKKKPLVPIMGWIFPRKNTTSNETGAHSPKATS